ncbi:hypothetical protein [Clostridium perfringens]|uniref:hypothetical protein n=1 Tax=Clostridium perfringens TaxID=1502 RepID=UPI001ABB55DB|nr:hypothetical protein [Clostridium perfringens]MBO3375386.1 hypothetical protein [Clostridium perfringens]
MKKSEYKTINGVERIRERLGCPICQEIARRNNNGGEDVFKKQCHSHAITNFYQKIISENGNYIYHLDKRHKDFSNFLYKKELIQQSVDGATAHKLFCSKHDSSLFSIIENSSKNGGVAYRYSKKETNENKVKHFIYTFRSFIFSMFEEIYLLIHHIEKYTNINIRFSNYTQLFCDELFKVLPGNYKIAVNNIKIVDLYYYKKFCDILFKVDFDSKKLLKLILFPKSFNDKEKLKDLEYIESELKILNIKTKVYKIDKKMDFLACTAINIRFFSNWGCKYYVNTIPGELESFILLAYFDDKYIPIQYKKNKLIEKISGKLYPNKNKFIESIDKKFQNENKDEFYHFISRELIIEGDYLVFNKKLKKYLEEEVREEFFKCRTLVKNKKTGQISGLIINCLYAIKMKKAKSNCSINLFYGGNNEHS